MAIVYRTSDTISLQEIDPREPPTSNQVLCGSFTANYLCSFAYDAVSGKQVVSPNTFAIYTISKAKINYIILASYAADKKEAGRLLYLRAWQVASHLLDNVVAQLIHNRGVLDVEYDRLYAVTHGFQYSINLDSQKQKLYDAEDKLPKSAYHALKRNAKYKTIQLLNEQNGMQPTDPGWAFDQRQAVMFGEMVLADYGLDEVRMSGGTMRGAAATCSMLPGKRVMMFHRQYQLGLHFSEYLPICRGVILHEIAHAIDAREFGGFSHGPTFVLVYCELLGKYTSIGFEQAFDHFISYGVKVANPIYSDQFATLTKARRKSFRALSQQVANAYREKWDHEV